MPLLTTGAGAYRAIGGGGGLMLDGITTGLKAAYSTRKLLTAYAGSAVRVQRASDNAQQDIGFSSNVLDTSSLNTFCSGTNGGVITWYDQSGGGHNLTQGTFASAPLIYQSGTGGLKVINTTRPAIEFVGGFLTNATLAQNPVNTLFLNTVASELGLSGLVGGSVGNNLYWRVDSSGPTLSLLASVTANIGTSSGNMTATGSVIEAEYNSSTGAWSHWIDGAASGSGTNARTFAGGGVIQVGLDTASSEAGNGNTGELVMYDQVGSFASRTTVEANQKAYWGTP